MKNIKLVFNEQSTSKHAISDIADRLNRDVDMIYNHLINLIGRPNFEDAREYIEENVVLVLDDANTPFHEGTSCARTIKEAKDIFEKHGGYSIEHHIAELLDETKRLKDNEVEKRDLLLKKLEDTIFFGEIIPETVSGEIESMIRIFGESSWPVLGYYLEGERDDYHELVEKDEITIFLRNCSRPNNNNDEVEYDYETILSTLAHQIFNAYFTFEFNKIFRSTKGIDTYDFRTNLVLESLASYFEASFDHNHNLNRAAIELIDSWRKHAVLSYPVAGADRIWENDTLFRKYFELALIDFVPAYVWLVYQKRTYGILDRHSEENVAKIKLGEILLNDRLDQHFIDYYLRANGTFNLDGHSFLVRYSDLSIGEEEYYNEYPISLFGEKYFIYTKWDSNDLDKLVNQGF